MTAFHTDSPDWFGFHVHLSGTITVYQRYDGGNPAFLSVYVCRPESHLVSQVCA